MGIGRVQGRAALAAIKAGTTRATMLQQAVEAGEVIQGWILRRQQQDADALPAFAVEKAAQFATFVAALPDPPVDQTP